MEDCILCLLVPGRLDKGMENRGPWRSVRTGVYRATWEGPGEVRVLNQCQVIDE